MLGYPFRIARRYLFARKSTNAINVITAIAIFGVAIGSASMIIILSVFNGFSDLFLNLFANFNPDLKLAPLSGKTFTIDTTQLNQLRGIEGIETFSLSLEEVAFFENKGKQVFGVLKGVEPHYRDIVNIDSVIYDGAFRLSEGTRDYAVFGMGLAAKLDVKPNDLIRVFMVKKQTRGPLDKPFKSEIIYPSGIFNFQQEFDQKYVIGSLEFAQALLESKNKASYIELKAKEGQLENVKAQLKTLFADQFTVKDQYEQEEAAFKVLNIEKWLSFALLSLTILLVSFNIIGALWMIVLEKRNDLSILKAMGATDAHTRQIFWWLGILLCLLGLFIGFVLALLFYWLQTQFGIIRVSPGAIVSAYPIKLEFGDFLAVGCLVLLIGWLASIPAGWRAYHSPALRNL